jgi:predicted dienelactone hydrolase
MPAAPEVSQQRDVLPSPTGDFHVGRLSLDLIDPNRQELYSDDPDDRRELVLWVWYPASSDSAAKRAEYLPPEWTPVTEFLGLDVAGSRAHAVADAPLADERASYPVLILSPSGFPPLLLAAIAEELASSGYVVVGVNHTYETAVTVFTDGRTVPMNPAALGGALGPQVGPHEPVFRQRATVCRYKAADLRSVADHLELLQPNPTGLSRERLDLTRLGALGHSFGGNAALEWCRADPRCRAAANLDGAIWTEIGSMGLQRPALQLLAQHPEFALSSAQALEAGMTTDAAWYEAEKALTFGGWRTIHDRGRPAVTVQIAGATHMSFMDVAFLPLRDESPVKGILAATSIDPGRMWRITCDMLQGFFAQYLDGGGSPDLDSLTADYPEITLGPP